MPGPGCAPAEIIISSDEHIVERIRKEHNKLVDLRDRYGLQAQGHGELHLAHFCLTGNLEHTDHVKYMHNKECVDYNLKHETNTPGVCICHD